MLYRYTSVLRWPNSRLAYKKKIKHVQVDKSRAGAVNVQFGIGSTTSIGSLLLDTPIGVIEFHVVEADTSFLLCLEDMGKLNVYFNNLENVLIASTKSVPVVCRFEAAFDLSFAAQIVNLKEEDAKALNKRIQWQIDHPTRGLRFVRLDLTSLKLVIFTDASFANNHDLSSRIGFVITLVDSDNKANIIHWSSIKCKRVTRSVLASELYAMVHGFDVGAVLKSTIEGILKLPIPMILCTDSKSLYDCLVKLGTTQEKRLMVDIMCLRQSYERREHGDQMDRRRQ